MSVKLLPKVIADNCSLAVEVPILALIVCDDPDKFKAAFVPPLSLESALIVAILVAVPRLTLLEISRVELSANLIVAD